MDITIKTMDGRGVRNVTLWPNEDGSVSLLGNLEHNTTIVVDQKLVDDLQKLVYATNRVKLQKLKDEFSKKYGELNISNWDIVEVDGYWRRVNHDFKMMTSGMMNRDDAVKNARTYRTNDVTAINSYLNNYKNHYG